MSGAPVGLPNCLPARLGLCPLQGPANFTAMCAAAVAAALTARAPSLSGMPLEAPAACWVGLYCPDGREEDIFYGFGYSAAQLLLSNADLRSRVQSLSLGTTGASSASPSCRAAADFVWLDAAAAAAGGSGSLAFWQAPARLRKPELTWPDASALFTGQGNKQRCVALQGSQLTVLPCNFTLPFLCSKPGGWVLRRRRGQQVWRQIEAGCKGVRRGGCEGGGA